MRRQRRHGRGIGPLLRQMALALLSLVVTLGVLRAGSSYLYCAAMEEVRTEECCKRPCDDGSADCSIVAHHDCCAMKKLRALPSAMVDGAHAIPAAPLLTIQAPPPLLMVATATKGAPARLLRGSTGPPRPSERPARLQVFLI